MPFGPTHDLIKLLSKWSLNAYFHSITSVNSDVVPEHDPIIVASNHWSMIIDPALLSTQLTYGRKLHYWAKNTLFKNPLIRYILIDSGNIPVDRTTKNNQLLFKGTFDVLKLGEAVALFPEGTSYTQPRVMQVKDGIGWTALEYAKNLRLTGDKLSGSDATASGLKTVPSTLESPKDVTIVIIGLNYTDKTRYRSSVQLLYAPPIRITQESVSKFMNEELEGGSKLAVKEIISELETKLKSVTINSPDWSTLHCTYIVREFCWNDGHGPMTHYRDSMQRLIQIFSPESSASSSTNMISELRTNLILYHEHLEKFHTTHRIFSRALPTINESYVTRNLKVPQLMTAIEICFRWPFFSIPAMVHLPIYLGGYLGSKLQPNEPESMSQNKLVMGLLGSIISFPIYIHLLSSFLLKNQSPSPNLITRSISLIVSTTLVVITRVLHDQLVNQIYDNFKRFRLIYNLNRADPSLLDELIETRLRCEIGWNQYLAECYGHDDPFLQVLKERGARVNILDKTLDQVDDLKLKDE